MLRILIMEISDRIKQRLADLGLKSVDIIKATGVTSGGVSQWVNGATKPKGEKLLIIARLLKCSPDWLISGRGEIEAVSNASTSVPILDIDQARIFLDTKTLPAEYKTVPEMQPGTAHIAFGFIEESQQFEPAFMAGAIYYIMPMKVMSLKMLPGRLLACWVNDHIVVGRMKPMTLGQIALLMPDSSEVTLERGLKHVIGLVTHIYNP